MIPACPAIWDMKYSCTFHDPMCAKRQGLGLRQRPDGASARVQRCLCVPSAEARKIPLAISVDYF